MFVAEGVRVVEELGRSTLRVRGVLISPQGLASDRAVAAASALRTRKVEVIEVTDQEFESAAETESPQGILAIAEVPQRQVADLALPPDARLLVLDGVQDPGNVGTILRTAAALEAAATLALPGTVDLWNAKVVRSAMGAHFHHPALACSWDELEALRREQAVALWAADAGGQPVGEGTRPSRIALVVGNEGAGISGTARERADRLVALPISPAVESLNVAVAAGILLYAIRR